MELMEKQGYKQTEMGLIPEDWDSSPITKLTKEIFLGLTSKVDYVKSGGYPLIRASDIAKGRLDLANVKFISSAQHKSLTKYRRALRNNVLVSKSGSLGVCAIVDTDIEFSIYESIIVMQVIDNKLSSLFLLWLLRYEGTQQRILGEKVGSSVAHLNIEMFRKLEIPRPTLTEQKAIATALSDVDALITSLEQSLTKKKAIKQGAMQALLTGKIRLKGFGEAKAMKDSELGLIPEDWDVKWLPEVFDYIHGKAHEQHIDSSGRFTVVNSKFISTEGKVTKNSKENFCPALKGDILTVLSDLPNGKALAKTYFVNVDNKYAVNQRICIWRSKKDSPLFLSFIMNRHKYFMKFDDGVTQTHILNHHIEKCPVLVPRDLNEQNVIGQILSDMDAEITQLETKKEKYHAIKQGMMQELLTGKTRLV